MSFNMFHACHTKFGLWLMIGFLAACSTAAPGTALPGTPATISREASPTPSVVAVTAQPLPPTALPDTPISLTLWLPTRFMPQANNPAYSVLRRQLDDFAQSPDGVPSQIVIKQDRGAGGLLDLLRTASPVAPSVLPDVIALDSVDLETAARTGLLQPIGSQLPADLVNDLYPFARALGTINNEFYGLAYSTNIEHLAGKPLTSDTATPFPATWNELLANPRRYLFLIGNSSTSVSDAVLVQYLSAGGAFTDNEGQPALDELALRTLLETYQDAQAKGVLPANLAQYATSTDIWNAWRGTGSTIANLSASLYLSVETRLPDLQYAALPSFSKLAQPIGRGWSYAIVTKDPRRQSAALHLIEYLLAPAHAGEWTQASGTLPGRAAALTTWPTDGYTSFLDNQLTQAQPAPSAAIMAVVGAPLRKAVDDVLAGRATPAEAAHTAVLAVKAGGK